MTEKEAERLCALDKGIQRRTHLKKFALTLLQQCKDENLSISELGTVIEIIKREVAKVSLRDGLAL